MLLPLTILSIAAPLVAEAGAPLSMSAFVKMMETPLATQATQAYKVQWMRADLGADAGSDRDSMWPEAKDLRSAWEALEGERVVKNQNYAVDLRIFSHPQLKVKVDKKMDSIDAAIEEIIKWGDPKSARQQEKKIKRDVNLPGWIEVQWMYDDAGKIPALAESDRWSKWKNVADTVDELEFDYPGHRSIEALFGMGWDASKNEYRETKLFKFKNMSQALTRLKKMDKSVVFKWKWSTGRETVAKKGKAEDERIESWGEHVNEELFEWSIIWTPCKTVIADLQAHAQKERDRKKNNRFVRMKLKNVHGEKIWDEPGKFQRSFTVSEAITKLEAYRGKRDAEPAAPPRQEL